jgi:hypothetical protein
MAPIERGSDTIPDTIRPSEQPTGFRKQRVLYYPGARRLIAQGLPSAGMSSLR